MTGIDLHHVILIMVSIILIKMVIEIIVKVAQATHKKVPSMILEYRQGSGFTYPYQLDIEGASSVFTKHQIRKKFQAVVRHPYARTVCEGGLEEVFKDPNKKMSVREIKTRALYIKVGEKERCIVLEEL